MEEHVDVHAPLLGKAGRRSSFVVKHGKDASDLARNVESWRSLSRQLDSQQSFHDVPDGERPAAPWMVPKGEETDAQMDEDVKYEVSECKGPCWQAI
jgi:hypothetical protein